MTNEIQLVDVEEQTLAAVRGRLAPADIPAKAFPMMDKVWAFIRGQGLQGHGHNVWLYRRTDTAELDMDVGVQLPAPFPEEGDVTCSRTPAGKAAHTVHYGEYHELPGIHQAIVSWCAEHGHARAGQNWEVYGDWHEDAPDRRTDVYHLIVP